MLIEQTISNRNNVLKWKITIYMEDRIMGMKKLFVK